MPPAGDVKDFPRARPLPEPTPRRARAARGHVVRVRHRQRRQRVFGHAERWLQRDADDSGHGPVPVVARLAVVDRSRASGRARAGQASATHAEPALAFKDGKLYMPFGSPGNDMQPQAMLQVFLNVVVWGMDPQAAVEAPRFATYSFPSSSEPHEYHPGRLNVESRIDRSTTRDALGWHGPQGRAVVGDRLAGGRGVRHSREPRQRTAGRRCGPAQAVLRTRRLTGIRRGLELARSHASGRRGCGRPVSSSGRTDVVRTKCFGTLTTVTSLPATLSTDHARSNHDRAPCLRAARRIPVELGVRELEQDALALP